MTVSPRRVSKPVFVGVGEARVQVGGDAPIAVQSMCSTVTENVDATVAQLDQLKEAGCDIVRIAVPDRAAADALPEIVRRRPLPIIADIHFDYRWALAAIDAGFDGLRLNPGNIRDADKVKTVAAKAKERGMPIRIAYTHQIGWWNPMPDRDLWNMGGLQNHGTDMLWLTGITPSPPDDAVDSEGGVCSAAPKLRSIVTDVVAVWLLEAASCGTAWAPSSWTSAPSSCQLVDR